MWPEHAVIQEDLERTCAEPFLPWASLHGTTVLVTGATGLIGGALVKALLWYGGTRGADVRVRALVRDRAKAEQIFAGPLAAGAPLSFLDGDVAALPRVDGPVDFVVHGAGVTASRAFVTQPVDTIRTALRGTEQVLEAALEKRVRALVYLSSMEVYGAPDGSRRVTETDFATLDPMAVRSSYPESKRMAEAMCAAYAAQHGLPARVLRLTQTFGPGVAYDDGRVFAQFARAAAEGHDIVLHTAGETERSYLYTADAVTAILATLLAGADGEAYHAADESSYCSVRAMADLVARECATPPVAVRVEPADGARLGYAPTLRMDLDTTKLRALGWAPRVGLADMYRRMMATM